MGCAALGEYQRETPTKARCGGRGRIQANPQMGPDARLGHREVLMQRRERQFRGHNEESLAVGVDRGRRFGDEAGRSEQWSRVRVEGSSVGTKYLPSELRIIDTEHGMVGASLRSQVAKCIANCSQRRILTPNRLQQRSRGDL